MLNIYIKNVFKCNTFFIFLFYHWNLIFIRSEFYLSAANTKGYGYTQKEVQKIMGTSLQKAPSRVRQSQMNPTQATHEERYQG